MWAIPTEDRWNPPAWLDGQRLVPSTANPLENRAFWLASQRALMERLGLECAWEAVRVAQLLYAWMTEFLVVGLAAATKDRLQEPVRPQSRRRCRDGSDAGGPRGGGPQETPPAWRLGRWYEQPPTQEVENLFARPIAGLPVWLRLVDPWVRRETGVVEARSVRPPAGRDRRRWHRLPPRLWDNVTPDRLRPCRKRASRSQREPAAVPVAVRLQMPPA